MTIVKILLVVSGILLLQADHCTYASRILGHYSSTTNAIHVLYPVAKKGNQQALTLLINQAIAAGDPYWIAISANLMAVDDLYLLALEVPVKNVQKSLLSSAAQRGHAQSQYALGTLAHNSKIRERWFTAAAEQGYTEAKKSLFEFYLQKNQNDNALKWGRIASFDYPDVALQMATLLWKQGNTKQAIVMLQRAEAKQNSRARRLLKLSDAYSLTRVSEIHQRTSSDCGMTIQFVAATLPAMSIIDDLIRQYSLDQRFDEFPVCFNAPLWVESPSMDCTDDPNLRLTCSVSRLIDVATLIPYSHAVVVAEHGVANVHNGVMYLDEKDDYQVFLHEFAHFAGFVDEYPISRGMVQNYCTREYVPNLVFAKTVPQLSDTHFAKYTNKFPQMTLVQTQTCGKNEFKSFKPVTELTFLEQHEVGVIPEVYLDIWRDVLHESISLVPAYVNFAQYYESTGQPAKAQDWWQRYYQFKQIPDT